MNGQGSTQICVCVCVCAFFKAYPFQVGVNSGTIQNVNSSPVTLAFSPITGPEREIRTACWAPKGSGQGICGCLPFAWASAAGVLPAPPAPWIGDICECASRRALNWRMAHSQCRAPLFVFCFFVFSAFFAAASMSHVLFSRICLKNM